jgi:hypothetical protein
MWPKVHVKTSHGDQQGLTSRVGGVWKHERTSNDYQVPSGLRDPAPTNAPSHKILFRGE